MGDVDENVVNDTSLKKQATTSPHKYQQMR